MDDEKFILDLEELWHTSDTETPLHEFLRLTKEQYAAFVEGRLSYTEVRKIYEDRA